MGAQLGGPRGGHRGKNNPYGTAAQEGRCRTDSSSEGGEEGAEELNELGGGSRNRKTQNRYIHAYARNTMIFIKWNRLNRNCSGCVCHGEIIYIASERP